MKEVTLNEGQAAAVDGILSWLQDPKGPSQALLSGEAGTGKTFCLQVVATKFPGRIIWTAPTNKATKVLRTTLREGGLQAETKTIYSLLGLRLQPNGEIKELMEPEEEVDLSKYAAVVVDEGSMVNDLLLKYVRQAQRVYPKLRFLFVGDSAQLPPVGQVASGIWSLETKWHLSEQMRNAGPILELAKELREKQAHPAPSFRPISKVTEVGQVNVINAPEFEDWIRASARAGEFGTEAKAKVICWRNVTVDFFNKMIRRELFDTPEIPWLVGDRIILTEPARDFIEDTPIGSTDDEGIIDRADVVPHPLYGNINCWRLAITTDDNRKEVLWVIHHGSENTVREREEELAAEARANGRKWRDFWEFKESFHKIRHAYAITAHRSQGSTYEKAFVAYRDILVNRSTREKYQCLYVACTRAKRQLILG